MKKYTLTTCTGIKKEFNYLEDLAELLASDPITELTDNEIVFLDAGMDIKRKSDRNEFLYKVEVKAN